MTRKHWLLVAALTAAVSLSPFLVGAQADDKPREPSLLGEHDKYVRALAFSPDGKTLASGDKNRNVQLWDAATGKALGAPLDQGKSVWALAFSPDGRTLASAGNGAKVRLWDVATGKEAAVINLPDTVFVSRLTFSPSGKQLAVGSGTVNVRLCDVEKAREYAHLRGSQPAYSPDGKTLAVAWSETITLRDLETGKDRLSIACPTVDIDGLAFAPDGQALASVGSDKVARLWDLKTGKELAVFQGHTNTVLAVAFSPDGKTIASGGQDKTVRLWDVPTPK